MDTLAQELIDRHGKLAAARTSWESHWQEVAELVLPRYSGTFQGEQANQTRGGKKTEHQYEATAALALERFAAAMESMLTPRNSRWHRLRASDDALNKDRETALWFDQITDLLFKHRYSPRANYASQQHEQYISLGAFGTGAKFTDALDAPGGGLRYRSIPLGECCFALNHQGVVDSAYRKFLFTARQAVQKWGKEKLPEKVLNAYEKNPNQEFEFLHVVMPRAEVDRNRADFKGMPFASYYVSIDGKTVLSEGGYGTLPYDISRYVTAPTEVYGRGPGIIALPAIKTLQEQQKTLLKQGQRSVDPVLLLADDGVLSTFNLRPGAMNFGGVSPEGRPLVHTLPTGNVAVGFEMMDRERGIVNDAFLVTLFQILVETPQMTATEVLERAREKGALLSPTMGRQQSESLGPMIERELDLLAQQGLLPEMPPALLEAEGEYTIEYDSPLSRAQKAEEASGLFRTLEWATAYTNVTQDPSPFDWIDVDAATPEVMAINAVPERWKRSLDAVEKIREGRNQQAQIDRAIEAAPALAGAMKGAGNAG